MAMKIIGDGLSSLPSVLAIAGNRGGGGVEPLMELGVQQTMCTYATRLADTARVLPSSARERESVAARESGEATREPEERALFAAPSPPSPARQNPRAVCWPNFISTNKIFSNQ